MEKILQNWQNRLTAVSIAYSIKDVGSLISLEYKKN